MKLFVTLIALFWIFMLPSSVQAQEAWVIDSFDAEITIQKDGTVAVREEIRVDFQGLEKHGIYRTIPYRYTNQDGSKLYTSISDISTGTDQKKVEREGDSIIIRIGDPDSTLSGKKQYSISYDVTGVLQGFDAYDELYWNVTGNYWEVPIRRASAVVRLPNGRILSADCFSGRVGSNQQCTSDIQDSKVFFQASPLSMQEGMTIVVSFPKGTTLLPTIQSFEQRLLSPLSIATLGITLLGGIGFIFWLWYWNGRDVLLKGRHLFDRQKKAVNRPLGHRDTIVVEYTPPEHLKPAEIGVLMDERADTLDVTATIIDLAVRGFLTITEVKKKWLFGSTDYILDKKQKDTKGLLSYEKKLYDELFQTGDQVKVSSLKQEFYTELKLVKDQLYADVVSKHLFSKNPESVRSIYMGIAIGIIVVAGMSVVPSLSWEQEILFMISVGLAVTGVNLLIVSRAMPRRSGYGSELYRRARGYELFISNVEKHRQQFFEKKNMFNEVLPYAIVFGLTEKFAKGLEKIGYKPTAATAAWYHGTGHFSLAHFQSQVSAFSGSLSTAISSSPSGSGSGGSGFSGGGFGGGGGGSW